MAKPRVILTRRWPQAIEAELADQFDLVVNRDDVPFDAERLRQALAQCDALCPTVCDRLDSAVLAGGGHRARVIANFGVGFNHIDLDAARAAGLVVTNTPEVLTDCTADLAITLMLMVARRAGEGERELRAQAWRGWRPTHMLGTRVSGKTLGLIGFGRIGQAVARRARHGFGMHVMAWSPRPPARAWVDELDLELSPSLEALLARADFVSLHCPGGAATRHLINAERLALMPAHAFLINTARGEVVDYEALIDALQSQRIAGAGLDVYPAEPQVPAGLLGCANAVLLPHLGSATSETRIAMGRRVLDNLRDFFSAREPRDRVV